MRVPGALHELGRALRARFDTRGRVLIAVALLAVLVCARADAASLLPLRTQEAATLPSGSAEIVLGGSYFHNPRFPPFTPKNALRSQELVTAPQLALQVAAGGWAEIQAFFEMIYLDQTDADGGDLSNFGNGDAQLWTKVRLLRERERRPGAGLRFGVKLPNANKSDRLGTDEIDFSIEALISKQLGPVGVHANLGIALLGNPGPPIGAPDSSSDGQDDLFTYAVAVTGPLWSLSQASSLALRLMAEVAGAAGSRFDNDRSAARVGLRLSRGNLTGYLGTSFGLVSASEDVGVTAGLLYAFTLERLALWVE
jgi:hypothetical protein